MNPIYVTFYEIIHHIGYQTSQKPSKVYEAIDCFGDMALAESIARELHNYANYNFIRISTKPLSPKYKSIFDGKKFFNPKSPYGTEFILKQ